jgi:sugar lactone lactonase YvrE
VNAFTSYGPFYLKLTDQYGNVESLGPIGFGVEPAPLATIALATTPSAAVYTDLVTLNYTATGNYPSAPTGIITTTLDGGGPLFSTLANGTATFNFGTLAPGTHTATYNYAGDSVYPGTGGTVPGQPANGTVTVRFTVAYPPYYLTGTTSLLPVTGSYDAIDAYDNVYIANTSGNTISKYDTSGNTTTVPTTGLNQPRGMVFDGGGNLYIADSGNNRIVELAPNGTQTVLPMGTYTLSDPSALAMDATYQNLWIVDQNNGRVLDYNLANQAIVTGNTVTGFSNNPVSVAVAKNGVVYAGSRDGYGPGGLYSFTPGSAQPTQFTNLPFSGGVYSMAFDRNGTLYVFAADNLYRVDAYGVATEVASSLNDNTEMAVNSQGTVLLTAQSYGDLAAFTPGPAANAGLSVSSEGFTGNPPGGGFTMYFHSPSGTTLTSLAVPANSVYTRPGINAASDSFASVGMARGPNYPGLQRSSLTATFSDGTALKVPLYGNAYNTELGISPGVISQTATNTINSSTNFGGITIDQNGNVYFIDTVAKQVYEVFQGIVTPIPFTGLNTPAQVAVDGNGDVYVLDSGTSRILKYNNTASQQTNTTTVVFDLSRQNALGSLTAFALDGATDLYIAGQGSNGQPNVSGYGQIDRQSAFGGYTIFSTGLSTVPTALAVDGNATVYSGDGTGQLVQYNHVGTPTTLASAPGPITSLAIEASGTVYATTTGSAALTVVSPQGGVSSHSIAGVTQAVAVVEDGAGTLTVADGATGKLFAEVRDAYLLYTSANANAGTAENLNFPATVVGTSSPVQSYTLTNTGTTEDAYGFNGLYLTNLPNRTDFPQDPSTTCTTSTNLAAGASCVLAYSFHPASAGYDSEGDNLDYSTTHLNNGYSTTTYPTFTGAGVSQYAIISLSASGATPFSACTGNCALGFGSVGVGQSATLTLTVSNGGGAALNIASIALTGNVAYSQTSTCGATLASLASCTVSVVFTPATTGAVTGTLKFTDNSNGSPGNTQTVSLTGMGVAAPPYVFVVNSGGSLSSLYSNGSAQSSAVAGGGIGAAVDRNGLVFSLTPDGTGVSIFYDNGTLEATSPSGLTGASALAIDGGDQLWIAAPGSVSMGQILGSAQVSYTDSSLVKPSGVAIDISGNVWISDSQSNTVHEIVGGGLPTQPLANALTNKTPGTEPQ